MESGHAVPVASDANDASIEACVPDVVGVRVRSIHIAPAGLRATIIVATQKASCAACHTKCGHIDLRSAKTCSEVTTQASMCTPDCIGSQCSIVRSAALV